MPERTKAYYVERISRTVTTVLVYADSAAEAKANAVDGDEIDSQSSFRGFGRVHRAASQDILAPAETPAREPAPDATAAPDWVRPLLPGSALESTPQED